MNGVVPGPNDVIGFWFGRADDSGHTQPRPQWFRKDAAFDALVALRFGALIEQALCGGIDHLSLIHI